MLFTACFKNTHKNSSHWETTVEKLSYDNDENAERIKPKRLPNNKSDKQKRTNLWSNARICNSIRERSKVTCPLRKQFVEK